MRYRKKPEIDTRCSELRTDDMCENQLGIPELGFSEPRSASFSVFWLFGNELHVHGGILYEIKVEYFYIIIDL